MIDERLRLALIGNDPEKWLPVFFPEAVTERKEVSEEDLDEDEGITFEFEDMDLSVAEDLLGMAMAQSRQGTLKIVDEEWR